MNADPAQAAQAAATEQNEGHWSLVSVAFGAVTGVIISMLIRPVIELLPGKLFEEFLSKTVETVFSIGLPILRLHRSTYSPVGSIPATLSGHRRIDRSNTALIQPMGSRRPSSQDLPIVSGLLTMVETWVFLLLWRHRSDRTITNQRKSRRRVSKTARGRRATDRRRCGRAGNPDIGVTISVSMRPARRQEEFLPAVIYSLVGISHGGDWGGQ